MLRVSEMSFWTGGEEAQDPHTELLNSVRLLAPALLICLEHPDVEPTKHSDDHGLGRARINDRLSCRRPTKAQ